MSDVLAAVTPYRSFVYHRTQPARIVETREEFDRLLADGWADTPAAFTEPERVAPAPKGKKK